MPQRRRRLLKKSDPETSDPIVKPDTLIGWEPSSATGSEPDIVVATLRRYERLSPHSVRNIKGILTHLGNLETKMGILEITTRKLVEMTHSSLDTLVQTVQDLLDNTTNKDEIKKLKAQVVKLERQLKTKSVKRLTAEDDLKDARKEVTKRQSLEDILDHYVQSMDEVFHIGARVMLERELWEKYFSSNPLVPEIETYSP